MQVLVINNTVRRLRGVRLSRYCHPSSIQWLKRLDDAARSRTAEPLTLDSRLSCPSGSIADACCWWFVEASGNYCHCSPRDCDFDSVLCWCQFDIERKSSSLMRGTKQGGYAIPPTGTRVMAGFSFGKGLRVPALPETHSPSFGGVICQNRFDLIERVGRDRVLVAAAIYGDDILVAF